jgi:hypothetical protein
MENGSVYAVIAKVHLFHGRAFVLGHVALHGATVDDDFLSDPVCKTEQSSLAGTDERSIRELADDYRQTPDSGRRRAPHRRWHIEAVNQLYTVLPDIPSHIQNSPQRAQRTKGFYRERDNRNAGPLEFVHAKAVRPETTYIGRELGPVESHSDFREIAFASSIIQAANH